VCPYPRGSAGCGASAAPVTGWAETCPLVCAAPRGGDVAGDRLHQREKRDLAAARDHDPVVQKSLLAISFRYSSSLAMRSIVLMARFNQASVLSSGRGSAGLSEAGIGDGVCGSGQLNASPPIPGPPHGSPYGGSSAGPWLSPP